MQVVDVLRDHARCLADAVKAGEREMTATGLGGGKLRLHGKASAPSLVAHVLACEELFEWDRSVFCPEPAGRTEIRDAALGGNSGSGKGGDNPRALDELLQFVDCGLQIRRDHVCFTRRRCNEVRSP